MFSRDESRVQRRLDRATRPIVEAVERRVMLSAAYALYQFNEGSGSTVNNSATDTSTSGASGTIVGSGVTWAGGKEGSALSFPGSGAVDIGNHQASTTPACSRCPRG
jgi:hypothetical protein